MIDSAVSTRRKVSAFVDRTIGFWNMCLYLPVSGMRLAPKPLGLTGVVTQ